MRVGAGRLAAVATVVAVLCGIAVSEPRARSQAVESEAPACPGRAPAVIHPAAGYREPQARLVRAGPALAVICVYDTAPAQKGPHRPERLVVQGTAADSLALLLDQVIKTKPHVGSCYMNDAIFLSYSGQTPVEVIAQECPIVSAVVRVGSRFATLSPTASGDLRGASIPLTLLQGVRSSPTPDFIGRPLRTVERAAAPGGEGGSIDELQDSHLPFGSVAWQNPLPGVLQPTPVGAALTVATRPSAPCSSAQLSGRYFNGGNATGFHFGSIEVFDTSARRCELPGRLTLTGLDVQGRPDTPPASEEITPNLVLSARASVDAKGHYRPGDLIFAFGFVGEYRDDPNAANGLCSTNRVYPDSWDLRLGPADVRFPDGRAAPSSRFNSCYGNISFGLGSSAGIL